MYSEKVMDHFTNPRNVGEIENASGVGTVGNAKCGDIMRIYLDIDENQIKKDFINTFWLDTLIIEEISDNNYQLIWSNYLPF